MKRVLPHDAKVSKGSKEAMQEMVGEFICFVTSEANDLCKEDPQPGKKTLHGAHITGACANLDLAELVAPIRAAALPTSRGSAAGRAREGQDREAEQLQRPHEPQHVHRRALSTVITACGFYQTDEEVATKSMTKKLRRLQHVDEEVDYARWKSESGRCDGGCAWGSVLAVCVWPPVCGPWPCTGNHSKRTLCL